MGEIYYNLGFLSSKDVVECSVVNFIAEYVGQTRPKTRAQLEKALGKVLVIDNAQQLLMGQYAQEALEEIMSSLGMSRYRGKMVVVLAGYTDEMNVLLKSNRIGSLFPNEVEFKDLTEDECLSLLERELNKIEVSAPFLKAKGSDDYKRLKNHFRALSRGPFWGNAHDIKKLAEDMKLGLFSSFFLANRDRVRNHEITTLPPLPELSGQEALACTKRLIQDRRSRCKTHPEVIAAAEDSDLPKFECQYASAEDFVHEPIFTMTVAPAVASIPVRGLPGLGGVVGLSRKSSFFPSSGPGNSTLMGPTLVITTHIIPLAFLHPLVHTSDALSYYKPEITQQIFDVEGEDLQADSGNATDTGNGAAAAASEWTVGGKPATAEEISGVSEKNKEKKPPAAAMEPTREEDEEERVAERKQRLKMKYQFSDVMAESTARALKELGPCPCGYSWKRDLVRHVCTGGSHFIYDGYLRDYMDTHGY